MKPFFVISDVLNTGTEYVTGYWTGCELLASIEGASRYASLSEAELVLRGGTFYDPAIHEVEETDTGLQKLRFFDMVNEHGSAGGS